MRRLASTMHAGRFELLLDDAAHRAQREPLAKRARRE